MDLALLRILVPVILTVLFLIVVLSGYVKVPPDKTFIISGYRRTPKILIGRAGVKIPLFEYFDVLYLDQMATDIKTEQSVPTTDSINVNVDVVMKVRIAPDSKDAKKTSRNFLNKKPEQIATSLQGSLQSNMRRVTGTLTLKDTNTNCDSSSNRVTMKTAADTEKLGIETLSYSIQGVTDEKGLINNLGADNTPRIKKDVVVTKAQADRDVATAQAEANRAANDARVLVDTEIAQKNNGFAIRQSELKAISDTKEAETDAAYEIQKQAQEKSIQIATVNAAIAEAERDSELKEREAAVTQQALNAEISKKADVKKYRVEQAATAEFTEHQRGTEAKKYEQEREVETKKAAAGAAKYVAEQEASGIRAKCEAEVSGTALRGKAEAEAGRVVGFVGAEAMEKKTEAYQKHDDTAMVEMLIKALPDIADEIAKPLTQINRVIIIGGSSSNENGVFQLASSVPVVMDKLFELMKEATDIDLGGIMRASTYGTKVNCNLNVTGLERTNVNAEGAAEVPAVPAEKRETASETPAVESRGTNDTNSTNKHSGRKVQ